MSIAPAPRLVYRRPAAVGSGSPERCAIVIVGAGPVGLAAALELARLGVRTVLLEKGDRLATGSRSICWSKRTLEILDRSGTAGSMLEHGVVWQTGRVYRGERQLYAFDLLPETGHRMPAFINLQQYHAEACMIRRLQELGLADIRWRNEVTGVCTRDADGVLVQVRTPDGEYGIEARYVLACDGVHSTVRRSLGLEMAGRSFEERFLITDIRVEAGFPFERRFYFEPAFHSGQSALLHRQPDNLVRIDLQLGPDADPDRESEPERVTERIRRVVGPGTRFELEWISVYSFSCRRMERFRHGRVFFAGDAAHVVSPFGARGGNGGVQDVDNLAWKLALVEAGAAPASLLDSYDDERVPAADENILNAARSTDFMTPKNQASADLRDAVLSLAGTEPFARALVNSGRLSLPHSYSGSPLSSPDDPAFGGLGPAPGAPAIDAPLEPGWLLDRLGGRFVLLCFSDTAQNGKPLWCEEIPADAKPRVDVLVTEASGLAARRWAAVSGSMYLLRPDQHVAARWREGCDATALAHALARACAGRETGQ